MFGIELSSFSSPAYASYTVSDESNPSGIVIIFLQLAS